jgi:hypothetical protein
VDILGSWHQSRARALHMHNQACEDVHPSFSRVKHIRVNCLRIGNRGPCKFEVSLQILEKHRSEQLLHKSSPGRLVDEDRISLTRPLSTHR